MAEGDSLPARAVNWKFFCPACGSIWGSLEDSGAVGWSIARADCGCEHSTATLFPGDSVRGLRPDIAIPGSVLTLRPQFFPPESIRGLFLTSPQLACREVLLWEKWIAPR
jgi:hypothetical protein